MRIHWQGVFAFLSMVALAASSGGQTRAFTNAQIIPIGADVIQTGTLLVDGTKIQAIGSVDDVTIPAGSETVDLAGKVIMPGLVCTHSHIGGIGAADGSGAIQPGVRVYRFVQRA